MRRKRPHLRPLATMIAVAGTVAGLLSLLSWSGESLSMYAAYALVPLIVFIAVVIHELGHLAAALCLGGRIDEFSAVPLRITFAPLRLSRIDRFAIGDLGGRVVAIFDRPTIAGMTFYAGAGPAANAALAIGLGALLPTLTYRSFSAALVAAVMFTSGAMALANLLPFHGSDGANLLLLSRLRRRRRLAQVRRAGAENAPSVGPFRLSETPRAPKSHP